MDLIPKIWQLFWIQFRKNRYFFGFNSEIIVSLPKKNNMIHRILSDTMLNRMNTGKAIILMGARQVGKTTLIQEFFKNFSKIRPILSG